MLPIELHERALGQILQPLYLRVGWELLAKRAASVVAPIGITATQIFFIVIIIHLGSTKHHGGTSHLLPRVVKSRRGGKSMGARRGE
jgi:hypothetical protein